MENKSRFQKAKYRRQLYAMKAEWSAWREFYRAAMQEHQDDWLGSRFSERFEQVDELLHLLDPVMEHLEWMH